MTMQKNGCVQCICIVTHIIDSIVSLLWSRCWNEGERERENLIRSYTVTTSDDNGSVLFLGEKRRRCKLMRVPAYNVHYLPESINLFECQSWSWLLIRFNSIRHQSVFNSMECASICPSVLSLKATIGGGLHVPYVVQFTINFLFSDQPLRI